MTRSASGRAPASGRRGAPRGSASADKSSSTTPGGSRVTPSSAGSSRGRSARRTRGVQVAAIAFVVLLLVAMAVGCAKYDGDKAAFCTQLDDVPSFMTLAGRVSGGTDAEAAAQMRAAAAQFRELERVAPRSIRHTVAALGDAAERIESAIVNPRQSRQVVTVQAGDGSIAQIPIRTTPSQVRLDAFYQEMQNHHGTVSAVYSMTAYAEKDCEITDHQLDLGLFGYGPESTMDPGFGEGGILGPHPSDQLPPSEYPNPTVAIAPPATTRP